MSNAHAEKPVPQVALEVMMKRNKEDSDRLVREAQALLAENKKIEAEMSRILNAPPPSRVAVSFPPQSSVPSSRPDPMGGLLHAADALVRSWKRRNKKNFKQLELDLMVALERMNA